MLGIWASSFEYRDFRVLFGSTLVYSIGMGMDMVALGWLVLDMTNSPFMVAVALAARGAPQFFLGILSGAFADQVDRRILLRVIVLWSSLSAMFMAVLILTNLISTWHVVAIAMLWGASHAFIEPVRQAYIYDIVGRERALNGLALIALSKRIGFIIGPFIAGVMIAVLGVGEQYLAISVSYLIAHVTLYAIRGVGQSAPRNRQSTLHNLVGAFQLIRTNHILVVLMLFTALNDMLGYSSFVLLPVFARDVLDIGPQGLGVMNGVSAAGGTLAVIFLASLGDFNRKGLLMLTCSIVGGISLMGFSQSANLFVILAILAVANCCFTAVDTLTMTMMQTNVANEERGRAMGAHRMGIGTGPVGHIGLGATAAILGVPAALLISGGILAFIAAVSVIGSSRLRRLV